MEGLEKLVLVFGGSVVASIAFAYIITECLYYTSISVDEYQTKRARNSVSNNLPPFKDGQLWFNSGLKK